MSKKMNKKGFRLASLSYFLSLGTLFFALFAYFSLNGTFAWFGLNKRVDANGMAIKVKKEEDVNISLTSYKMVQSSSGSYSRDVSDTPHALNRYDQVFTGDNIYTPVILKLVLTDGVYQDGEELPLKIRHIPEFDSTLIRSVTDPSGNSSEVTDSTSESAPLSSYISSVLNVKAVVYNGTFNFNTLVSYFRDGGQLDGSVYSGGSHSFVNLDSDGNIALDQTQDPVRASKEETISIPGVTYKNAGGENSRRCTLYVYLDYNDSLINSYINQMRGGDGITLAEAHYALKGDLDYISIKREG